MWNRKYKFAGLVLELLDDFLLKAGLAKRDL
jgi:hypothetical protein